MRSNHRVLLQSDRLITGDVNIVNLYLFHY